ncbi:MAG: hypothetical protein GXP53_01080 [Deltaproteobacteria bacterium]|nr:hypothetical protein [Deltaproteobacteria bacterium]
MIIQSGINEPEHSRNLRPKNRALVYLLGVMVCLMALGLCSAKTASATPSCISADLADIPLDTQQQAAPGLVMFLIDDSGSMDWTYMTPQQDGVFNGKRYVFPNPGDNAYSGGYYTGADKMHWKGQWAEYNHLYYNPVSEYVPWPRYETLSGTDVPTWPEAPQADPDTPRSDPISSSPTFNLSDIFYTLTTVTGGGGGGALDTLIQTSGIIVDNADTVSTGVADIIVDDGDPGFWMGNKNVNQYHNNNGAFVQGVSGNHDYYSIYPKSGKSKIKVDYTFNIPQAGPYEAWVSIPKYSSRTNNVKYIVRHQGIDTNVWKSQNNGGGLAQEWVYLGQYNFDAGNKRGRKDYASLFREEFQKLRGGRRKAGV